MSPLTQGLNYRSACDVVSCSPPTPRTKFWACRKLSHMQNIFTARSVAVRSTAKASCPSVRLSVRPSVTLRYCGSRLEFLENNFTVD